MCSSDLGTNDEMHIVVVDEDGMFSGTKGTVLETYPFISKATDASVNGQSNYYKQVIFEKSKYIYAVDPVDYANTALSWGKPASTAFVTLAATQSSSLSAGTDDVPADANTNYAYGMFSNKEPYDISLVLTGGANTTVQQYVIDNIVTVRKDCVAFISPPMSAVVNRSEEHTSELQSH